MQTNKELKIAIIVGIIMVTICALVIIFHKSDKKNNEIDIQVYKVNEKEKIYERCSVPTDFLVQINSEYKRAGRIPESKRVIGQKITGLYKIVSGNDYIAFDGEKDKNYIYRGDTKYLYEFDSTMYNLVIEACK